MKTVDFLDALKRQNSISSDYALAKLLAIRANNLSNYRRGVSCFDADMALKVASLGSWPVGYVLACIEEERAERTKKPAVRKAWHEVAKALAPMLAAIALVIPTPRTEAAFVPMETGKTELCILC